MLPYLTRNLTNNYRIRKPNAQYNVHNPPSKDSTTLFYHSKRGLAWMHISPFCAPLEKHEPHTTIYVLLVLFSVSSIRGLQLNESSAFPMLHRVSVEIWWYSLYRVLDDQDRVVESLKEDKFLRPVESKAMELSFSADIHWHDGWWITLMTVQNWIGFHTTTASAFLPLNTMLCNPVYIVNQTTTSESKLAPAPWIY